MSRIVTLTLNPALDVFTSTGRIVESHKLRCEAPRFDPGGGGINVARAARRLGAGTLAVFPAGGATGEHLHALLQGEQVPCRRIAIAGETRESFSVKEASSGREFRFVLPGPTLSAAELQACITACAEEAGEGDWLVASGSLPPGAAPDVYARLAAATQAQLAVDTSGGALVAALAQGVALVKPSLRELRELTGEALPAQADWLAACRALVVRGQARMVALSLGAQGAMLVTRECALRAPGLPVPVASSIGAGDSFLAGLLVALQGTTDLREAFATAIAAGAAALLEPGTALCRPEAVARLREQVVVSDVAG
jgi:6-phosphofructokinase 2